MLEDIIEKLETATEGSRKLDAKMWCIVMGHEFLKFPKDGGYLKFRHKDGETPRQNAIQLFTSFPHYTTSLDAALTLVPKGWRLDELKNRIEYWGCILWRIDPPQAVYCGYNDQLRPESSALALCIAAFKARQVVEKTS